MSLIIDTSVLIEIENENLEIISKINKLKTAPKAEIYITFFTFCEFYYATMARNEKNKVKIKKRLTNYRILNTTQRTGEIFCETMYELQQKGKMIPQFDIFIASFALEHDMVLIATDNHFNNISHLKKSILEVKT
jgi:tRNA(fMet)-specific endonuclease VapC